MSMEVEEKISDNNRGLKNPRAFRTIHYLGSKLRVLESIKQVVDELDPERNGICDLFAGTGSVSQQFSSDRKVVSVDIQNYSRIICSALLNPISDEFTKSFTKNISTSEFLVEYSKVFEPLISLEDSVINGHLSLNLESVCNFLENSSLYAFLSDENGDDLIPELNQAFEKTESNLKNYKSNSFVATKYFGGVYFSFSQSVILDAIISEIEKTNPRYHDIFLASMLSTASDVVNTVGKQFAQPIRPRDKNGKPKKGILRQLRKDRNIDVLFLYNQWLNKYSRNQPTNFNHQIIQGDYKVALENLNEDVKVVYADPPYTRDHYSRFYHGLETLSLRDYPNISKTKIGGKERLSRGLYRDKREQSDFCIRSKAPKAFDELFKLVAEKNRILVLSYSPYDKSKGAHPRCVEIDLLEEMAKTYFNSVHIQSVGKFSHSKLNRSDLHLEANDSAEVLIICQN